MKRREFLPMAAAAAASAAAAAEKSIKVAFVTHQDGPHLVNYLPSLAGAVEAGSVVLADASGTVEAAARKVLGSKLTASYRDVGEMLRKEKPRMALVSMEAAIAPPAIRAALEAGCDVLAEKPACVKMADFSALASFARKQNRMLVLALANRIDPLMLEVKRLMDSGLVGRVFGVDMQIVADQTRLKNPAYHQTWFAKKERAGGGHLIWLGIHWLDLAMHFTGSRITDVTGFIANVGRQPLNVEDSATVTMRFENGTLGTMTSGYYVDKGYHSLIKIWGSDGWIELRKHGAPVPLEWYSNKEGKVRRYEGPLDPNGYEPFVRHIVRASAGLDKPIITVDDCERVLKTVYAAYRAAETGVTQKVS